MGPPAVSALQADPAKHAGHVTVAAVWADHVPGWQPVHRDADPDDHSPLWHGTGAARPVQEYPAGQRSHHVVPVTAVTVPGGQLLHAVLPPLMAYVLTPHGVHAVAPAADQVPARHSCWARK